MSWLDWAIDDPAPGNCGYTFLNVPCEVDPSLRRGIVIHSVEGWFSPTYTPSAVMLARGNSWGVTIMRSGQVWRHRPRPTFVNWHAGGPAQNIGTDGIEMEGKDQPWTDAQRASLVRVLRETWAWFGWPAYTLAGPTDRTQEGIRQALLAHGYGSLWEHRWFDYTSCPSGRDDWPWLMPVLQEEDGTMTNEQLTAILTGIQGSINHTEAASQVSRQVTVEQAANVMNYVEAASLAARASASESDRREADRVIAAMREQLAGLMVGGGGLTFDQHVAASKQGSQQAARAGTG